MTFNVVPDFQGAREPLIVSVKRNQVGGNFLFKKNNKTINIILFSNTVLLAPNVNRHSCRQEALHLVSVPS